MFLDRLRLLTRYESYMQKVNFFLTMFNLIYFKLDLPQFKQQLYPLTKAQELEIKKDFPDYKFGAASAEPKLKTVVFFR